MTAPTDRTRLRRAHERGSYDAESLYKVLDATCMCNVAYVIDGKPYATPTLHWREGNHVYWHGSSASRMLKKSAGAEVCLTVSILDGFVMARSGFHHSVNYRAAMLFGTAFKVLDDEKEARLDNFVNGLWPGRMDVLRPNDPQELKGTTVLGMEINEASAKVSAGGPVDDDEDYELPIWAGVIPVETRVLPPEPDPRNLPGVEMPDHIRDFKI
ncbi:pyridoxamine 5'-phosphate oxidase family protein [Alisedimentitalea sp. MJ-SS2]|uniref:pyridoxamine 5'-phosphate oxidase family protein n=1 Tax=Aliisedimentitalea sp. MJ-SS2 TaxID=3049795 RepID=UPI00290ACA16|nr:pyridoxamine 5'-phosphate oxidase family protein [Alisedimentitalea sp. MJ-SS2]MDU8927786.1 pyridoxamine 5'-phosphate oxidase family protein [Alisedimentitalea sp. MJ-SS2]